MHSDWMISVIQCDDTSRPLDRQNGSSHIILLLEQSDSRPSLLSALGLSYSEITNLLTINADPNYCCLFLCIQWSIAVQVIHSSASRMVDAWRSAIIRYFVMDIMTALMVAMK